MNILFVCTGNTCRSPMAESILRAKSANVSVRSAGIVAGENGAANPLTARVLDNHGIELDHRSQQVDQTLLNWADLVLTMTTQHKQSLIIEYPDCQEKLFTLKEYVNSVDKGVWDELQRGYKDLEEKRTAFVNAHEHQMDHAELNHRFHETFKADVDRIEKLEAELFDYEVSDPFGGDIDVYERTFRELDACIDRLVDLIKPNRT